MDTPASSLPRAAAVGLFVLFASVTVPVSLAITTQQTTWISALTFVIALVAARFGGDRARALLDALRAPRASWFVGVTAALAFATSWLLVSGPLHDRPFSIDAAVYLFQARALSHGHFGAALPTTATWFGGRFLFEGADGRLHGVFPPGWPLFLAPFAALSVPMLAGPVVAALLAFAQWLLGREIEGEDGLATRAAIVLSLPSFARAVETADLLSHAFVAAVGTAALALALSLRTRPSVRRAAAIGAAIGWATAARLLDGIVLGSIVAAVALFVVARGDARRRAPLLTLVALAAALPFVALVLFDQRAATGSWWVPTQSLYFARSDWPPTCHRLGFGADVGCFVEHATERKAFGDAGYGALAAYRVTVTRAGELGVDLFGPLPIALAALFAMVLRPRRTELLLGGTVVLFTFAYALFYYGNAPVFGARHLFPVAPALLLLVSRAVVSPPRRSDWAPALSIALFAAVVAGAFPRWKSGAEEVRRRQSGRVDLRSVIDRGLDSGLVVTADNLSWIAGFDPAADGDGRITAWFDQAGLKDVRRAHPDFVVHSVLEGDRVQSQRMAAPPPGLSVELERAWPSFVRPHGVGARVVDTQSCCNVPSSGEHALFLFHAEPGASLDVPFVVPRAGRFALHLEGLVAPDYGTWSVAIDGAPFTTWEGWAATIAQKKGDPVVRDLAAGRHVLTFRCEGKRPESTGHLAAFDVLVGTPAP